MKGASISTVLGKEVWIRVWSIAHQEKKNPNPKDVFCGLKATVTSFLPLNSLPVLCWDARGIGKGRLRARPERAVRSALPSEDRAVL